MKKYIVRLEEEERSQLQSIIRKGKSSAHLNKKARILLKADQNQDQWLDDIKVASSVDVSVSTVERLRKKFVEEGFEACLKPSSRKSPAHNLKLDGELEAQIATIACSSPPKGRSRWTLRMIADQLVTLNYIDEVSISTVARGLKKK